MKLKKIFFSILILVILLLYFYKSYRYIELSSNALFKLLKVSILLILPLVLISLKLPSKLLSNKKNAIICKLFILISLILNFINIIIWNKYFIFPHCVHFATKISDKLIEQHFLPNFISQILFLLPIIFLSVITSYLTSLKVNPIVRNKFNGVLLLSINLIIGISLSLSIFTFLSSGAPKPLSMLIASMLLFYITSAFHKNLNIYKVENFYYQLIPYFLSLPLFVNSLYLYLFLYKPEFNLWGKFLHQKADILVGSLMIFILFIFFNYNFNKNFKILFFITKIVILLSVFGVFWRMYSSYFMH